MAKKISKYMLPLLFAAISGCATASVSTTQTPPQQKEKVTFQIKKIVQEIDREIENGKNSSIQLLSPHEKVVSYLNYLKIKFAKTCKNKDNISKGKCLYSKTALGENTKEEIKRYLNGDDKILKLFAIESALKIDDEETAKMVAEALLNEKDEEIKNAEVAALLTMKKGYLAVMEIIENDPTKIEKFKDILVLSYLNTPQEKRKDVASSILELGYKLSQKSFLEENVIIAWSNIIKETNIHVEYPFTMIKWFDNIYKNLDDQMNKSLVGYLSLTAYEGILKLAETDIKNENAPPYEEVNLGVGIYSKSYGKLYKLLSESKNSILNVRDKLIETGWKISDMINMERGKPKFVKNQSKEKTLGSIRFYGAITYLIKNLYTKNEKDDEVRTLYKDLANKWSSLAEHFLENDKDIWKVVIDVGIDIGANLYEHLSEIIKNDKNKYEEKMISALSIAKLAAQSSVVAKGSIKELIKNLRTKGEKKLITPLSLALAYAIYNSYAEVPPSERGTWERLKIKNDEEVEDLLSYAEEISKTTKEGGFYILWSIYATYEVEKEKIKEIFEKIKPDPSENATLMRKAFVLSLFVGNDEDSEKYLKALLSTKHWATISSALMEGVDALTQSKEKRNGYILCKPGKLPPLPKTGAYLYDISINPTVPPSVRGTAAMAYNLITNNEALCKQ